MNNFCQYCSKPFAPKDKGRKGKTVFCGLSCYWASKSLPFGSKYGRWTVLGFSHRNAKGYTFIHAKCECGTVTVTSQYAVKSGQSFSCGCFARERKLEIGQPTRHGLNNTGVQRSYNAARQRCTNPKNRNWPNYGGRGIEFRFNTLEELFEELGHRPTSHSIDRIDNDGHYEQGNVRWATASQQNRNQRRTLNRAVA